MERLSGLDAGFLYMETPTLHMHTLKIAVLEPVPGSEDVSVEWVRQQMQARLHLLPPLRRRVVEVPFGFHHPVWIEDPDLDITFHVRAVDVAAPGGGREMDAAISAIASRPLDRRRPLWEMYLLRGLADERIGILVKLHHAAADGVASAQLLANVMTTSVDAEPPPAPPSDGPDAVPGPVSLLFHGFVDHLEQLALLPALLLRTLGRLVRLIRHRRASELSPPRPVLDTPDTRFNGALTANRTFHSTSVSLPEVKRVKAALDVTVNDVVLAIVAGSLRAYLLARDELPDAPLMAGVPVSTDKPEVEARLAGNKVSNLLTTLATDEPDPLIRLRAIHAVTAEAKVVQNLLGAELMANWVQYTPPRPYSAFMRWYSRFKLADHHAPPINVVVSNVPGPRAPLYAGGARLLELYSVGPILEGIGLNITVWSYLDDLFVGIIGCPETLPDPERITAGIGEALAELGVVANDVARAAGRGGIGGTGGARTAV